MYSSTISGRVSILAFAPLLDSSMAQGLVLFRYGLGDIPDLHLLNNE